MQDDRSILIAGASRGVGREIANQNRIDSLTIELSTNQPI